MNYLQDSPTFRPHPRRVNSQWQLTPTLRAENEEIADLLTGLTDARKTWGFGLCFLHLRNVKGHPWNHMA
jgi:hypothetical protein